LLDYHRKLEHTTKSQMGLKHSMIFGSHEVWLTSYANILSLCPAEFVSLHLDVKLSIKETVSTGRSLQIFFLGMDWPLEHVKQV